MEAVSVAIALIAVATLGNLLLLFAVIRRLRYVQQLVAPAAPLPAVGSSIAPFRVDGKDDTVIDDHALDGDPVIVAFLSVTCPACHELAVRFRSIPPPNLPPLIFVVADQQNEKSEALVRSLKGLGQTAVVPYSHPALLAFGGINAFPTVLLAQGRRIVAAGTELEDVLGQRVQAGSGRRV